MTTICDKCGAETEPNFFNGFLMDSIVKTPELCPKCKKLYDKMLKDFLRK